MDTSFASEWELGEYDLLKRFYNLIVDLQRGYSEDRLRIIGHNILRFDLFFLYNRMRHHQVEEEKWLYQWLINKPKVIDFLQLHLPLNNFKKELKHDVFAEAYGFKLKKTLGSDEILHYYQGDFTKIIKYSECEFIYPQLYQKILSEGMVSREKLLETIRNYQEKK